MMRSAVSSRVGDVGFPFPEQEPGCRNGFELGPPPEVWRAGWGRDARWLSPRVLWIRTAGALGVGVWVRSAMLFSIHDHFASGRDNSL